MAVRNVRGNSTDIFHPAEVLERVHQIISHFRLVPPPARRHPEEGIAGAETYFLARVRSNADRQDVQLHEVAGRSDRFDDPHTFVYP
jgi:hypothetical protein